MSMTPAVTHLPGDAPPVSPSLRWLVGADRNQRVRAGQCCLAVLMMLCSVLNMNYLAWIGVAPWTPTLVWSAATLGGFALFFAAIRCGVNLRLADPSMGVPQMGFAILCCAAGYAIAGEGRAGPFMVLMGVFMFGMYGLTPGQMRRVGLFGVAVFGATMVAMNHWRPGVYEADMEWSHFFALASLVPMVAVLTVKLNLLAERSLRQRMDLASALARIQELATRDELTGLINRRHMFELLEQELQRSVRSGQTFCIALVDIDGFAQRAASQPADATDRFLQNFAQEAMAAIRISDLLSRWDGHQFLLLLSDTRTPFAKLSLERLRERILNHLPPDTTGAASPKTPLSVGLAEHRAAESIAQTIGRAEEALRLAQGAGGNRLVSV